MEATPQNTSSHNLYSVHEVTSFSGGESNSEPLWTVGQLNDLLLGKPIVTYIYIQFQYILERKEDD